MNQQDIQFDNTGKLRHFLTIEDLPRQTLIDILDTAENFSTVGTQQAKKVPLLRGKTIVNLFFEGSTRTRTTFELAAKRLSADVLNININTSSASLDRANACVPFVVVNTKDSPNAKTFTLVRAISTAWPSPTSSNTTVMRRAPVGQPRSTSHLRFSST